MPKWFILVMIVNIFIGIVILGYVTDKCGAKGLLLGNGGLFAAASGMCDENKGE